MNISHLMHLVIVPHEFSHELSHEFPYYKGMGLYNAQRRDVRNQKRRSYELTMQHWLTSQECHVASHMHMSQLGIVQHSQQQVSRMR